jgi:cytochrome c peroxidase
MNRTNIIMIAVSMALSAMTIAAIGAGPAAPPPPPPASPPPPPRSADGATPVSVGGQAFNDKTLSLGGNLACASCHNKSTGHADPAGTYLPMGGPNLNQQGYRSSLSLNYLSANTPFGFGPDGRPHGGFFWDGRADSRAQQAAGPLFTASEMANTSVDSLAAKLKQAAYYADFARLYNVPGNASSAVIVTALEHALATYQAGDSGFMLFNSRFDQYLDGTLQLSASEMRGMGVFNDARRGNCASCHTSAVGPGGGRPIFTDFSYHAHGLPRNKAIVANADPNFYDMGLCGPKRTDLAYRVDLCGMFRTPTLRNIALTAPYFHNATATTLVQAVSFYATRDVDPSMWYPLLNGVPDKFNDLPLGYRGNVDSNPPFGLGPGNTPRLSIQDVMDLTAFLGSLTDNLNAPPASPVVAPH